MSVLRVVLAVLATWRLSHLLAREDGPLDLIVRIRARLGRGLAGRLMDCFQCVSLWVAAPLALGLCRRRGDWPVAWLGLSGAACIIDRVTRARERQEPPGFTPP